VPVFRKVLVAELAKLGLGEQQVAIAVNQPRAEYQQRLPPQHLGPSAAARLAAKVAAQLQQQRPPQQQGRAAAASRGAGSGQQQKKR
jgi:hypothetical protein